MGRCNKSKQTRLETTINPSGGHSGLGGDVDEVYNDQLETMQGSQTVSLGDGDDDGDGDVDVDGDGDGECDHKGGDVRVRVRVKVMARVFADLPLLSWEGACMCRSW